MPAERPLISVCIVTGRRSPLLDAALASLAAQEDPPPFELLVCADDDEAVEATVRGRFPGAHICVVPRSLPGAARNHLVERARGDLLLFLDDDVAFGPDLLRRYADVAAAHPEASVFGGPNATPRGSTRFQVVQGAVLASLVASGPVRRRYGAHPAGPADEQWFILCNLAVRRPAMLRFDDDIVCAEENALLAAMHRQGLVMHYDPALAVYHERRGDLAGFARQMHKYGRGRGQLVARRPATVRLPYLAPPALVTYLAASPVLAVLVGPWVLAPAGLWASAVAAGGVRVTATLRRPRTLPLATLLVAVVHLCYGSGVLRGLARPRSRWTKGPPRWLPAAEPHEPAATEVTDQARQAP